MKKEEILNRLSDIISFYSDEHTNPQNKTETKEWNKTVEAGEIVEKYFEETYPLE
jgi:hypothetical protein